MMQSGLNKIDINHPELHSFNLSFEEWQFIFYYSRTSNFLHSNEHLNTINIILEQSNVYIK